MRRTLAIALVTAGLIAGVSGCTGGPESGGDRERRASGEAALPAPGPKACANGRYTWTGVKQAEHLTGVSEAEQLGKDGGELRNEIRRVYTPEAAVRAEGPRLAAKEVLLALAKEIGLVDDLDEDSRPLAEVHAAAPGLTVGATSVHGAGRFVQYAGVKTVEGDFRYSCPGGAVTEGHAKSWKVDISGVLDCQETADDALAVRAARLSCEPGDPAVKA